MNIIIQNILLLGSLQGFILAVFIVIKKNNVHANKFLFISILFLSISLLANFGELQQWHLKFPHLIETQHLFIFVFMPALYFYVLFTVQKKTLLKRKHLFHLLPILIYFISRISFFIQPAETKLIYIYVNPITISSVIQGVILNFYPLFYIILILILLSKYSQRIEKIYSNIEKVRLTWLKFISYFFLIAVLVSIFVYFLSLFELNLPLYISFSSAIIIVSLIYAIGYFAIQQPGIFNNELCEIEQAIVSEDKIEKINNSNFDDYYTKLLKNLEHKKTYLNPELTIKNLSEELSIPVYILSKVINEKAGLSFRVFINKYRIKEVQTALQNPANEKEQIIQLAYEAGFNSKSTFNYYFKKYTGKTPTQYRNLVLNNIN